MPNNMKILSDEVKKIVSQELNIQSGAQVNVLEGVKVGTTDLTPTNKVVTVPLATSSNVGVVKPDGTTVTVDSSGTLSANVPTITMRVYDED